MESNEESSHQNTTVEVVKELIFDESEQSGVAVDVEVDKCHKSNGVVETVHAGDCNDLNAQNVTETALVDEKVPVLDLNPKDDATILDDQFSAQPPTEVVIEVATEEIVSDILDSNDTPSNVPVTGEENAILTANVSAPIEGSSASASEPEETEQEKQHTIEPNDVEVCTKSVTFETEILVESNINDINENEPKTEGSDLNTNILSELGQNIELSEALRSSDISDAVENNNCAPKQEMFNKEELLDILEGNDVADSIQFESVQGTPNSKILEARLALEQLSRLKERKKKTKRNEKIPRKRRGDIKITVENSVVQEETSEVSPAIIPDVVSKVTQDITPDVTSKTAQEVTSKVTEENIVNVLVKDWDDEEPLEEEQTTIVAEESQPLLEDSDKSVKILEIGCKNNDTLVRTSIDSTTSDGQIPNINKSVDEGQPQKRLGRVIKKKVIFDPDNPDTFTKNKAGHKNREIQGDKEQLPIPNKKIKIEQVIQRSKSKSPTSKLQWKKPSPKNCKQNKRLTEVDKLLMDEGAVNMIYQLTPEAPKGKKNMKTKAEFIKKIQSSTPDSKEMKFRERKKDVKEEGEPRKILGGKLRHSLNSSVKSPSACEDFEAHSADDSIIYRRHSSSSYSSSCMSPRRLSDVEGGQCAPRQSDTQTQSCGESSNSTTTDVFMADASSTATSEVINKDDCLSIKEKLNSKLSLALNKRKREGTRIEKPSKTKKITKTEDKSMVTSEEISGLKYLSVSLDESLAEICIQKSGLIYTIEVMRELEKALSYINLKNEISVTLLTSESGTLCSGLDLKPLLNEDSEEQSKYARELAECVRMVVSAVHAHGKVVVGGASGGGAGLAAALLAACDVALGSERASYGLPAPPAPAAAALLAHGLPPALVNDMLVGRVLSASEAVQAGLVSRALWPRRFREQLRAIAKDIAAQPTHIVLMKKKLMQLSRSADDTFARCMEKERDLFIEYWSSAAGREDASAALACT